MATNEALNKLPSDDTPPFSPTYKKDLITDEKERAAQFIGFTNFEYITDQLDDITDGRSTRKLWRQAITHKDVYLPIRMVINLAFWVEAKVVPNPRNDYERNPEYKEVDEQLLEFIERVLDGQKFQTFERMLRDLATYGKICGYGVAEKIWQSKDGYWICDYKIKKSFDFTARKDKYSNLEEVWYYPRGRGFHPDAFIWAPWGHFGGNWLGQSDLIPIRHDILTLNSLQRVLDTLAAQLSRMPIVNAWNDVQISPADVDKWKETVEDAFNGKGSGIIHAPSGQDNDGKLSSFVDFIVPPSREGSEAIKALLETIGETKKDIKRALGMPDDMGMTSVPSGSWAKAKEEFNLLVSFAEEVQNWVQDLVNDQIINELVGYNWPEGTLPEGYCYPRFEFEEIEEKYEKDKAEFLKIVTEAGYMNPADLEDLNDGRALMGLHEKTEITPPTDIEPESDETDIAPEPGDETESELQESGSMFQKLKRKFTRKPH